MGTALCLKSIGMVSGYILLLVYALLFEEGGSVQFMVLAVVGIGLLFKPFDIIDFWFQAFVRSKYTSIVRALAVFIMFALSLVFVYVGLGVEYFALANALQACIIAIGLVLIYRFKADAKPSSWTISWVKTKELFGQGWIVYLGSIFAVVYLKIDQVMLRWLLGPESVGVYAVAAQLSEAWYIVPVAIVGSVFPKLIKLRQESQELFNHRLQQLFDALFLMAFVVAVVVTAFASAFIELLFGEAYSSSASVLIIHVWAGLFIFMRTAFSKWILIENALIFSLITQGAGAVLNIVLNFLLIPSYGVQGAAIATVVSYGFASFFSLMLYSKTRPVFIMMSKSFISILRYTIGRRVP